MKRALVAIMCFLLTLSLVGCVGFFEKHEQTYPDLSSYGEWRNSERFCSLYIFPDEISEQNVEDYYYYFYQIIFPPSYTIFLRYKYTEVEFFTEIDRLSALHTEMEGYNSKYSYYTEDEFNYPAYVTSTYYSKFYEYALLDRENYEIIYIMLQYKNTRISFDEFYLPLEWNSSEEKSGYTIYWFSNEDLITETDNS